MMNDNINDLSAKVDSNEEGIQRNSQLSSDAVEHANMLAEQAMGLKETVDSSKGNATKILDAANAYSSIADGVNEAIASAETALETADNLTQLVNFSTYSSWGVYQAIHSQSVGSFIASQIKLTISSVIVNQASHT